MTAEERRGNLQGCSDARRNTPGKEGSILIRASTDMSGPIAEALEPRCLFSSITLQSGNLTIEGDADTSNHIIVRTSNQSGAAIIVANDKHSLIPLVSLLSITIFGGAGADSIVVTGDRPIRAQIWGEDGDDTIRSDTGANNQIDGGNGSDQITTGNGQDIIFCGDGDDVVHSGGGDDTIDAGAGDDQVDGGDGADSVTSGPGSDTIVYDTDADSMPDVSASDTVLLAEFAGRPIGPPPTAVQDPALPQVVNGVNRNSVVGWCLIGGTVPTTPASTQDRLVGDNLLIKSGGWQAYIDKFVQPQLDWGVRRIILHNPFGVLPNEPFQFDEYIHAKESHVDFLINDFVKAWKPITQSGVEVICYLGRMEGDPDFETPIAQGHLDQFWKRFWESCRLPLEAGMSIGFDATSGTPPTHPAYKAVQVLNARGVKTYVEARPAATGTYWFGSNIVSTNQWWLRSDPDQFPDSSWAAPTSKLTGEIVRVINDPPPGQTWDNVGWVSTQAVDILSEGNTEVVNTVNLVHDGVANFTELAQLVAARRAQAQP